MDRWKLIKRNEYLCILCNNGFIKRKHDIHSQTMINECDSCHSTFKDLQDPSCPEIKEVADIVGTQGNPGVSYKHHFNGTKEE